MLRVDHLHKTYGTVGAIADLTLDVREREFLCVVGSSGCGKTTLLKCLAGLLEPTAGGAYLHGKRITSPPPTMAPVFQDYSRSLFPWMTVRHNVAFPLRRSKVDRKTATAAVEAALEAVGLAGVLDRYPWQLSGGMQQRVAIARALAYRPEVLLMDEPFASVDAQTRADLQDLMLLVRREYGVTVVFATHDLDEAVYLADRIVVLRPAPTSVQQIMDVDLPTPRDQLETKALPDFARLRASLYRSIKQRRAPKHGPSHVDRAEQAAPQGPHPRARW